MTFYLYVDHKPLASFLSLESALEAWWPLIEAGRNTYVVKVPAWMKREDLLGIKQVTVN